MNHGLSRFRWHPAHRLHTSLSYLIRIAIARLSLVVRKVQILDLKAEKVLDAGICARAHWAIYFSKSKIVLTSAYRLYKVGLKIGFWSFAQAAKQEDLKNPDTVGFRFWERLGSWQPVHS